MTQFRQSPPAIIQQVTSFEAPVSTYSSNCAFSCKVFPEFSSTRPRGPIQTDFQTIRPTQATFTERAGSDGRPCVQRRGKMRHTAYILTKARYFCFSQCRWRQVLVEYWSLGYNEFPHISVANLPVQLWVAAPVMIQVLGKKQNLN